MSLRIRSNRDCRRGASSALGAELASAPLKNRSHAVRAVRDLHDSSLVPTRERTVPQLAPTTPGAPPGPRSQQCAEVFSRMTPLGTEITAGPSLAHGRSNHGYKAFRQLADAFGSNS